MSEAMKCDRCGEFFERRPSIYRKITVVKERFLDKELRYDLCPECEKTLAKWMKMEEEL